MQLLVKENPHLGFAIVLQLTGAHGSRQFDRLTKTKTVESILSSMDVNGIKDYVDHLFQQLDKDHDEPRFGSVIYFVELHQLIAVVANVMATTVNANGS